MSKLTKAIVFALEAHGDQMYGDLPYIHHCIKVAEGVTSCEDAKVVAYLHDVLEDTSVNFPQLVDEFGFEVAANVQFLTKSDSTPYDLYIETIYVAGGWAKEVKLSDLNVNYYGDKSHMTPERRDKLQTKYYRAMVYLNTGEWPNE